MTIALCALSMLCGRVMLDKSASRLQKILFEMMALACLAAAFRESIKELSP